VRVALGVIYQMSNAMHQKFKERWKAAKSEINLVISATINKLVLEHHSAWFTTLIRNPEVWQKPSSPFYKVNYDTTICPSFSAQVAVIKNFSGAVIKCSSLISSPCLALFGEARAALLAVQLAISLNLPSFILEGDFSQLLWRYKIQLLHKIGVLLLQYHKVTSLSLPLFAGQLVMLTEVQTFVTIT